MGYYVVTLLCDESSDTPKAGKLLESPETTIIIKLPPVPKTATTIDDIPFPEVIFKEIRKGS